jgi:site-specific recombinase XerD
MFEKLFKLPAVLSRHQKAPFAEERRRYLLHCAQQGYAHTTLHVMADDLFWVARKLSIYPDLRVTPEQIKSAAKDWAERESFSGHTLNERWTSSRFIRVANKWVRYLGCLCEPAIQTPFAHLITEFKRWMKDEKGLSSTTIEVWSRYLTQFLCWYEVKKRPFCAVEIIDLDTFLIRCGKSGWSRVSINNIATGLRAFFRYAGMKKWCAPFIAEAIKGPRIFTQENLPAGPSRCDVSNLLASMNTNEPRDIRDRAIIMLFAIYGLRASEVTTLRLEDIDWEHDIIAVTRVKGRGRQIYPLSVTVGNAIVRYLQEIRPRCSKREVFLTFSVPLRPISRGGLYSLTKRHMLQLGISPLNMGPHSLRHACAEHLLKEGFSLKEIGDHLGHRSCSATRIYTKVDLTGLREVATFDLGGLI